MSRWLVALSTGHSDAIVVGTPDTANAVVRPWTWLASSERSKFAVLHADSTTSRARRFRSAISVAVSSPAAVAEETLMLESPRANIDQEIVELVHLLIIAGLVDGGREGFHGVEHTAGKILAGRRFDRVVDVCARRKARTGQQG